MNCSRVKNPCKICLHPVSNKTGLQCKGACKRWAHFSCLNYTPGKIQDIKAGIIRVACPCPTCNISEPKEVLTSPPYTCDNYGCAAKAKPKCEERTCPSNKPIPDYGPNTGCCGPKLPEICPSGCQQDTPPELIPSIRYSRSKPRKPPSPPVASPPNSKPVESQPPCELPTCKTPPKSVDIPQKTSGHERTDKPLSNSPRKPERDSFNKIHDEKQRHAEMNDNSDTAISKRPRRRHDKKSKSPCSTQDMESTETVKRDRTCEATKTEKIRCDAAERSGEEDVETSRMLPSQSACSNCKTCSCSCITLSDISGTEITECQEHRDFARSSSDSAVTKESQKALLCTIRQLCSTVGHLSDRVKDLMCKMLTNVDSGQSLR